MLEGPTLQGTSGDLVFYDLFQNPMVLVKVACKTVRDIVRRPKISDAECQLLAMRHKSILTLVAGAMLEKGESTLHQNGRFKVIEIELAQLHKVANQFSTDVLAMAADAHWGQCCGRGGQEWEGEVVRIIIVACALALMLALSPQAAEVDWKLYGGVRSPAQAFASMTPPA